MIDRAGERWCVHGLFRDSGVVFIDSWMVFLFLLLFRLTSLLFKREIPKMGGIFHYFNESFVIDPLNDFERHFAWLSKTSLLLKIGQSP